MSSMVYTLLGKLEDIKRATLLGVKDTLTIDECSMLTGYSVPALYSFTSTRQIPHFKRGKHLFFSKSEVEKWLQANPVPTQEQISKEATTYVATHKR